MPLTGTFRFVLIPADATRALEECRADKSGGIENDALLAHARRYFAASSSSASAAEQREAAEERDPDRRRQLAQEIRQQLAAASAKDGDGGDAAASNYSAPMDQLLSMSDDDLVRMFQSSQLGGGAAASCDITALTVPTVRNGHMAVSLYTQQEDPSSSSSPGRPPLPLNVRATRIAAACGHAGTRVAGDAFLGRANDDERLDVWERVDFPPEDADPASAW
jgi:hypothetical protein